MRLTLTAVHDTRLRGLCRVAGGLPSSPLLLSTHTGGEVWELDWQSKRIVRQYRPQRPLVQRLLHPASSAASPDGIERPLHAVRAIALSEDGPKAIDSDVSNGQADLVDLFSGQRRLIARGDAVFTAACTAPLNMIALGGHARITLVQWPHGRTLGELAGHNDGVRDMAFSPDGRLLVSVGGESEDEQHRDAIRLWDVQSRAALRGWMWHHLGAVAFHPGGEIIAVGCMMPAAIKLWHLASDVVKTAEVEAPGGISALCFSPDGQWLWAGEREGRVMLFTVADN
jgi:WD40 repeat protein